MARFYWLVVWNTNFMTFHSVGKNHPNWRTHIVQRGRYTTNQLNNYGILWSYCGPLPVIGMSFQIVHPKCRPPHVGGHPDCQDEIQSPQQEQYVVWKCGIPMYTSQVGFHVWKLQNASKERQCPFYSKSFHKNVACTCQPLKIVAGTCQPAN